MSELRECPWCQTTRLHLDCFGTTGETDADLMPTDWRVMHDEGQGPKCDAWGPECDTREQAIAAWNRRANDWQPINADTPKGRSVVLIGLYRDGKTWSDQYQSWWLGDGWARWPHDFPPTHWMPLPTPPEPTTDARALPVAGEGE